MADLLPNFETLTKLSGWAVRQAAVFPRIWESPKSYFDEVSTLQGDPLPASISFFAFVVVVSSVITIPLDVSILKVNPFSANEIISSTVLFVLQVLVFSLGVYIGGRVLGGKADLRETMAAMLFASAFMPLVELTKYLTRLDDGYRGGIYEGFNGLSDLRDRLLFSPLALTGIVLETIVLVYIFVKLVPLVKGLQSFGSIRALTTICIAGLIHQLYTFFVAIPIIRGMYASASNG
jgi:hypothetical protein